MNLLEIKILSEKKKITLKKIAEMIGMSEANLHRCIRQGKIEASQLEKIAELLNVNISVFFDAENESNIPGVVSEPQATYYVNRDKDKIIKLLEEKVEDQSRLIKMLEKKIDEHSKTGS